MRLVNTEITIIIKIIEPKMEDTIVFTFGGASWIDTSKLETIVPIIKNNTNDGMKRKKEDGFPPIIFFISSIYSVMFIILVDIFPKQRKKNTKTKIGL